MVTPSKASLSKWYSLVLLGIIGGWSSLPPAIAIDRQDHNDEDISQSIAWDFSNQVYCVRSYDISGSLLLQFRGGIPDFTPDGRHLLSASPADDRTYLYDLNGNQIVEFVGGIFQGFTANGQQLIISTASPVSSETYLYNFSGQRLVTFGQTEQFSDRAFDRGSFGRLSPNRQQVTTYSYSEDTSYLYDLSGNQIAQFEGGFLDFSPNEQQLVTYAYTVDKSYLYNIWGRRLAEFQGIFLRFSSNGQYLMTSTVNGNQNDIQNHVFDLLGNEFESLQLPEGGWTDNAPSEPASSNLPAFQGEFRSLSSDGQLLLTYSEDRIERRLLEERLSGGDNTGSVCPKVARHPAS